MERIKKYLESMGIKYKEEGNKIIIKTGNILKWINAYGEEMIQEETIWIYKESYGHYNYTVHHLESYAMTNSLKFKKYQDVVSFLEKNLNK